MRKTDGKKKENQSWNRRDERYIGGGANNPVIVERIQENLPSTIVQKTDSEGIPCNAKEAVAFALLGFCTLRGLVNNIPSVTGASGEAVLGKITPVHTGIN